MDEWKNDFEWTKTKLLVFSSCLEGKLEDEFSPFSQKNGSTSTERSDSLKSDDKCTSKTELFEEDDVFLLDQPRRSSEPVILKRDSNALTFRMGRQKPSTLRSLSEGMPLPEDRPCAQRRKLTRSASSSDARTAFSQLVTFSPQIVRKINLGTSLQDWLESEKLSRDRTRKDVAENIARNFQRLGSNDESSEQKSKGKENSPYRRCSVDIGGKESEVLVRRRPSAPPTLGKENDIFEKNLTRSLPCFNSDIKYDSVHEFQIHNLIKEELQSRLSSVYFCARTSRKWCEEISEMLKERVQVILSTPCKVVCTVYIGALRGHGIHTGSQAVLDCKLDHHVSAYYQNDSLFAAVSVLVVRYTRK